MKTTIAAILVIVAASATVTRAQRSKRCGPEKFECRNGDCIPGELLCDGRVDCKDGTDETEAECTKPEFICPAYAFRCAYGACVDGDAACNGRKDCLDNSDETLPRCLGGSRNGTENSQVCATNEFKCDNGQCIPGTQLCDGRADCLDKSDETSEKCSGSTCTEFLFRCNYGACVDGDAKCNGIRDCADGSDEDPLLCRLSSITPTQQPVTPSTGGSPGPWSPGPGQSCVVPPQPQNGYWKLHRTLCPNGVDCDVNQGTRLSPGSELVYTCNSGHKLAGPSNVVCNAQGTWLNIPVCVETRCPPLSSASTEARCTRFNAYVGCENSVLPGTVAELSCRTSYREDTTYLLRQRRVTCNERGLWEPEPIRCVPVCGIVSVTSTPFVVNGTTPDVTEFPWHATLYREASPGGEKEFICGATIIKDRLLLTAAHCIYDDSKKRIDNPNKYYIATGNKFRDYDYPAHDPRIVRKAKVKNIYIECGYSALDGNYAADIAVIEIAHPFSFTAYLVPICLDTSLLSDVTVLEPGVYGKVAGFGRTAFGKHSFILQALRVPYVPQAQCKQSSGPYDTGKYITLDKFCAGYSNGSAVCDGDSGGGLVFETAGLWYLRGIVSVGLGVKNEGGGTTCDPNTYSLYTRVSSHITWIQDVMYKLETYKSYPACPPN